MPKAPTVWTEYNRATNDYVVYRGQCPNPAVYIGRCDRKVDAERLAAGLLAEMRAAEIPNGPTAVDAERIR